eukprot:jgi/Orpsp1_1/1187727/evm.model.d7180000059695.1
MGDIYRNSIDEEISSTSIINNSLIRNNMIISFDEFSYIMKNSICQIKYKSKNKNDISYGTGFFVKFSTLLDHKPLYGVMTNYHVFGEKQLTLSSSFSLYTEKNKRKYEIELNDKMFIFTSKLIDITFIQLNDETIEKINPHFLKPGHSTKIYDSLYVPQYLDKYNSSFSLGIIKKMHGFNYIHTASTKMGSGGSPLIDNENNVVGIHKAKFKKRGESDNNYEELNLATRINIVEYAIHTIYNEIYNQGREKEVLSFLTAKELSIEEIKELNDHDLKEIKSKNIYSPYLFKCSEVNSESDSHPGLLFYRTNHAWYWTKNTIEDYSKKEISKFQWSIITSIEEEKRLNEDFDIDNLPQKCKTIIDWLRSTQLKYIISNKTNTISTDENYDKNLLETNSKNN